MTVDRNGNAWINYAENGKIYKVNLDTLECSETSYQSGGTIGFTPNISMGFSSNTNGGADDTLFISDNTGDEQGTPGVGRGVAKLDPNTLAATAIGAFSGSLAGGRCELTGTGDARLFGFFAMNPAYLAEIIKTDGSTPAPITLAEGTNIVDASVGGYAFAFWGGNFWFFTAPDDNPHNTTGHSTVSRYNPNDPEGQRISFPVPDVGFVIVGAGVSTCAPIIID
jgi:hypothetical protein